MRSSLLPLGGGEVRNQDRLDLNDLSRNTASRHRDPWSDDDLEWLMIWDHTEGMLIEIAEMLGRTIEACRQRYYYPAGQHADVRHITNRHQSGWMVGFCSECGNHTDVWCDGTNVLLCEEHK